MPYKNGNPPLFSTWWDMIQRCTNPNRKTYKHYGGRGIKVCPQWIASREQFCADMGPRPEGLTLERIDNDKDYTPENCKWATRKEQSRNQRVTRKVIIEGKEYKAVDLADISGQLAITIVERAKAGLTYEEVIAKERRYDLSGFSLGVAAAALKAKARTHCRHGHEFTPENTIINKDGNTSFRACRKCRQNR
jgi:hypothetical protein